ncbi:MAG: hypothetical protein IJ460_01310 [Clostridia bacterium]|nr:hypothetical protein [Clostridia bacterium]
MCFNKISYEFICDIPEEFTACPAKQINDPVSGKTYGYMNINGTAAVKGYVTQQSWNAEGTKFLVASGESKLYEYDTESGRLRFLDNVNCAETKGRYSSVNAVVTPGNRIYYMNQRTVYCIDWNTYKKYIVCPLPDGCNDIGVMQVTNDGSFITGYYNGSFGDNRIVRLNCETGELDVNLYKDFSYNPHTQGVGHPLINPEYPNLLFFCHEGPTQHIPDRLWLANADNGEMYNMFVQKPRPDGDTGECSGHEVWGMDGEYMYFVKYALDCNIGKKGIMRISKEGDAKGREYLTDDFDYWHCYPSSDNSFVVGDTAKGEVAMTNLVTGKSELLAKFELTDWYHPHHPHPVISYNNKSINWQMIDENNVIGVAWMNIR